MVYYLRDGFTDPVDSEGFTYGLRANSNLFDKPINSVFSQWLKSEPPTSFAEVLDDIAALLRHFEYGKMNHFLQSVLIECDQSLSTMILRNYSDIFLSSVNGHCGEVNDKAYCLIRYKYPTINMLKVEGQRGGFGSGWNHWFLLFSKQPFRSKGKIVFTPDVIDFDPTKMELSGIAPLDTEGWEPQFSEDILVGDASAGAVTELDLSTYVLTAPTKSACTSIRHLSDDALSLQVSIERDLGNYAMTVLHRSKQTMTLLSIGLHEGIPAPVIGVEEFNHEQTSHYGRRYKPAEYYAYDDEQLLARLREVSPDMVDPVFKLRDRFVVQ